MSDDNISLQRFCIMERKLLWGIATPGGVLTLVFGFWLLSYNPELLLASWMQAKLILIGTLAGFHVWCARLQRQFAGGNNPHGHVWYRWFNEIPVVILAAVVILAVLRSEIL